MCRPHTGLTGTMKPQHYRGTGSDGLRVAGTRSVGKRLRSATHSLVAGQREMASERQQSAATTKCRVPPPPLPHQIMTTFRHTIAPLQYLAYSYEALRKYSTDVTNIVYIFTCVCRLLSVNLYMSNVKYIIDDILFCNLFYF